VTEQQRQCRTGHYFPCVMGKLNSLPGSCQQKAGQRLSPAPVWASYRCSYKKLTGWEDRNDECASTCQMSVGCWVFAVIHFAFSPTSPSKHIHKPLKAHPQAPQSTPTSPSKRNQQATSSSQIPRRCHQPSRGVALLAGVEKGVEEHQDMEIVCVVGTRSWVVCAQIPRWPTEDPDKANSGMSGGDLRRTAGPSLLRAGEGGSEPAAQPPSPVRSVRPARA
jgi:hypothetical protein